MAGGPDAPHPLASCGDCAEILTRRDAGQKVALKDKRVLRDHAAELAVGESSVILMTPPLHPY